LGVHRHRYADTLDIPSKSAFGGKISPHGLFLVEIFSRFKREDGHLKPFLYHYRTGPSIHQLHKWIGSHHAGLPLQGRELYIAELFIYLVPCARSSLVFELDVSDSTPVIRDSEKYCWPGGWQAIIAVSNIQPGKAANGEIEAATSICRFVERDKTSPSSKIRIYDGICKDGD
jgi:hypothetical protein